MKRILPITLLTVIGVVTIAASGGVYTNGVLFLSGNPGTNHITNSIPSEHSYSSAQ